MMPVSSTIATHGATQRGSGISVMKNSKQIWDLVDEKAEVFIALSDAVWAMPELCFREHRSVAAHVAALDKQGFRVTREAAGLPTAVVGEAGSGGPVVAILGEFDALPGLSQQAGVAERRPVEAGGNGHGCGHNLLGAASLLAATAVKDWLALNGVAGRVRYYGCPAEEGGSGKAYMARGGAFDDVDIALTWHPHAFVGVKDATSLASTMIDFTFHGRAAHASNAAHLGRSALDAVELLNVAANYMREHIPRAAQIQYAILDAGGAFPNTVPAKAAVRYAVRGADVKMAGMLLDRIKKAADGAALMTETIVEFEDLQFARQPLAEQAA